MPTLYRTKLKAAFTPIHESPAKYSRVLTVKTRSLELRMLTVKPVSCAKCRGPSLIYR